MRDEGSRPAGELLNGLLAQAGMCRLKDEEEKAFEAYLSLFIRWNSRINLSSVRELKGILARHFVESISCARSLPEGIAALLDFGSGGGLPGVPVAICRPEIRVTLAESQGKKAAFLQEVVRTLGINAEVFAGRAETLGRRFECVTLRAVDKMEEAVSAGAQLVQEGGWLALMTTNGDSAALERVAGRGFRSMPITRLPLGEDRVLVLAQRVS